MYLINNPCLAWGERDSSYALKGLCMFLIIFHHLYMKLIQETGHFLNLPNASGLFLSPGGYLGTGLFFFLSGYGLYYSMGRKKASVSYLVGKIMKMLMVYVYSFLLYVIFNPDCFSLDLLLNFFTLTIPQTTTWFFKVIIGVYIITFLIFNSKFKIEINLLVISVVCIIYYLLARIFLPDFWYTSIMCFPVGLWIAHYKDKFSSPLQLLSLILFALLFLFVKSDDVKCLVAVMFSLMSVSVVRFLNVRWPFLLFVGHHSLCYYLLQLSFLNLLWQFCQIDWLYCLALLALLTISTVAYVRFIGPYANKKISDLCE